MPPHAKRQHHPFRIAQSRADGKRPSRFPSPIFLLMISIHAGIPALIEKHIIDSRPDHIPWPNRPTGTTKRRPHQEPRPQDIGLQLLSPVPSALRSNRTTRSSPPALAVVNKAIWNADLRPGPYTG